MNDKLSSFTAQDLAAFIVHRMSVHRRSIDRREFPQDKFFDGYDAGYDVALAALLSDIVDACEFDFELDRVKRSAASCDFDPSEV